MARTVAGAAVTGAAAALAGLGRRFSVSERGWAPLLLAPALGLAVLVGPALPRHLTTARLALGAVGAVPKVLGFDGPRTYLLLAQNSDELRATGGFITGLAILTVASGHVRELTFEDSYAVEDYSLPHPLPPTPLVAYLRAGLWALRDANWSPDFPTSARAALDLYQLNRGVRLDGVVAVDLAFLEAVIRALGPVTVPGYQETVHAGNAVSTIEKYWASPSGEGQAGDWWQHRKDFVSALLQALIREARTPSPLRWLRLASALHQSIQEKHLLLYAGHPAPDGLLRHLGWDASVARPAQDYLMLVDSNLGYNKVDRNIHRSLLYEPQLLPDGRIHARVTITYANVSPVTEEACIREPFYEPTYQLMTQGCYWDYLRLYVPAHSALLGATGLMESAPTIDRPEAGKQVLATFFELAPGERRSVSFEYRTRSLLRPGEPYRLFLQKQPGTGATPAIIRFAARTGRPVADVLVLPAGWPAPGAAPSISAQGGRATVELSLDRDRQVVIRMASSPLDVVPRWAWALLAAGLGLLVGTLWRAA